MPIQLGSAYGQIVLDFAAIQRGVQAAVGQLRAFETQAKQIGQSLQRVGDDLTRNVTLPLVAVGTASAKMSMDFEASMQQIVGLVGESQQQVNAWKQDLQQMGPEISRGPKELADALYFVTSAGIKGAAALDIVEQSGRAAAAGLGETQVIADAASSAINAYGASNITAGKAIGVLVATVREGKAEANQIAPALGRVIPIASQLGISFDQVGAAMAAMTRVGFDAAESATNLSGIMSALLKPSKQASDVLAEFGLSGESLRQTLKEKGLLGVLTLLKDTIGQDDEALAKIFPNIRGFRGLLSLVGDNADETRQIFTALANTTEADLDKAFEAASQTMKFKFNAALADVQVGLTKIGDAVLPVVIPMLKDLANTLKTVTTWFSNLDAGTKQTIVQIALIVAAVGPVLAIGGRIISTIGTVVGLITTLGTAFVKAATFAGQFVKTGFEVVQYLVEAGASGLAVVGAFAALAAAVVVLIKFFDAASRAARSTNEELIAMSQVKLDSFENFFTRAGAAFELIVNGSTRLRDVFLAHQDEMQKKLAAGEITLEDYNAEIERSAKAAGVWTTVNGGMGASITKIDGSVKILTADQVRLLTITHDYASVEDLRAKRVAESTSATAGLTDAMQEQIDAANAAATAQQKANAENEAATAQLDQLKALIDGQVGPAYEEYINKNDDLIAKQKDLRDELAKLEASQGKAITVHKKAALSAAELELAQLQLADAQAKLASETNPIKQAQLAVKIEDLTGKIQGADSATTTWVDNSKRIGEIKAELGDLNQALDENAQAYDDRLKRILFDMATEQLAANGLTSAEMSALNQLAVKFGLIDQDTAAMTADVLRATDQLAKDNNVGAFVDAIVGDLDRAKQRAADVPADLAAIGQGYAQAAKDASTRGGEVVTATWTMANQIGNPVDQAKEKFGQLATGMTTTSGTVQTQATAMQNGVTTAVQGMSSAIQQHGPAIGNPLLSGFQSTRNGVIDALNEILGKVADVISSLTGLHVPKVQIPGGGDSGSAGGGSTGGSGGSGGSSGGGGGSSGGGGGSGSCFIAGTPITLTDWSTKPIELIKVGDCLQSFDSERGEFVTGTVTKLIRRIATEHYRIVFESGMTIEVTGEHPFFMPQRRADVPTVHGDFVRVKDLRVGDTLTSNSSPNGRGEKIVELIEIRDTEACVYNFNVEPWHTYLAHGCIVHNIKMGAGGPFAAGQRIVINESALTRPEVIVPSMAGYVLTRQDAQAALIEAVNAQRQPGPTVIQQVTNNVYDAMAAKVLREQQRRQLLASVEELL